MLTLDIVDSAPKALWAVVSVFHRQLFLKLIDTWAMTAMELCTQRRLGSVRATSAIWIFPVACLDQEYSMHYFSTPSRVYFLAYSPYAWFFSTDLWNKKLCASINTAVNTLLHLNCPWIFSYDDHDIFQCHWLIWGKNEYLCFWTDSHQINRVCGCISSFYVFCR